MNRLTTAKPIAFAQGSLFVILVALLLTCLSVSTMGQTPEVNYASPIDLTSFERPPVYTGNFFATSTQETNPRFVQFSSDGLKMFVLGTSATVQEYNLTIPFSIASGVTAGESLPVGAFGGLFFNYEGDRMFIVDGAATDQVIAYNLSTNYSLSSATQGDSYNVSSETVAPFGVRFDLEGTRMFVVGSTENSIFTYSMGSPYDILSASLDGVETLDVSGELTNPRDIAFNADGSKLFVMNPTDDNIVQYSLSVPFALSSAVPEGSFSIQGQETNGAGLTFDPQGQKLFIVGNGADRVNEYDLSTVLFVEPFANDGTVNGRMILWLNEKSFTNTGTNMPGGLYSVANVPPGLTPDIEVAIDGLTAELTFFGSATNSDFVDDINNLTVTLLDGAFVGGNAAGVANATAFNTNFGTAFNEGAMIATVTSPLNGSFGNPLGANIDVTFDKSPNPAFVNSSNFKVVGSQTGNIIPTSLTSTGNTISFVPDFGYIDNEEITVIISDGLEATTGEKVVPYTFEFTVSQSNSGRVLDAIDFQGSSLGFNGDDGKILAADINKDAYPDLIVTNDTDDRIEIHPGNGDGTFGTVATIDLVGDYNPNSIAVADINGDGNLDVITGNSAPSIDIYFGDGTLNPTAFQTSESVTPASFVSELIVGDINLDGRTDIVYRASGSAAILERNSTNDGFESEYSVFLGSGLNEDIDLADLNGDGYLDIAGTRGIVLSNGIGGFQPANAITTNLSGTDEDVKTGDFNNDGVIDLLVASNQAEVSILLGNGDGTVGIGSLTSIPGLNLFGFDDVSVADLNGDGFLDFVGVGDDAFANGDYYIVFGAGDGTGSFTTTTTQTTLGGLSLTLADFTQNDGNNLTDIAAMMVEPGAPANNDILLFEYSPPVRSITYSAPVNFITNPPVFDAVTFAVTSEDTNPEGMTFNADGTKVFIIGREADEINQYSLATPYDFTTGVTFDGSPFSLGINDTEPVGLRFNPDGTKLFVLGYGSDAVHQYSLANPYDITIGVTYDGTPFDVSSENLFPQALTLSPDGTRLYMAGQNLQNIHQYGLNTPFDITGGGAVEGSQFTVSSTAPSPRDLRFDATGTKLFVLSSTNQGIEQYTLTTPFDINGGIAYDGTTFSLSSETVYSKGFAFNENKTKFYIVTDNLVPDDEIFQYSFTPNVFTETVVNDGSVEGALIITLINDTFVSAVAVESNLVITNLPSGLTPSVALSVGNTVATVTLTGSATANESANSTADLQLTFGNGAFTGGDASGVFNAIGANTGLGIAFDDAPPTAPSNLIAYELGGNIELEWTDSPDEDNYDIERSTDYVFSSPVVVATDIGAGSNSFTVATPQPNQYYRVVAKNGGGSTPSSPEFASTNPFPGQVLQFDGTDDYVLGNETLGPLINLTVSAWVYPTSFGSSKWVYFRGSTGTGGAELYITSTGFAVYGENDGDYESASTAVPLVLNEWNHVAAVKTGASVQMYLNGQLSGTPTNMTGTPVDGIITIGARNQSGSPDGFFTGQIDELRLWDDVRTEPEIQANLYDQLQGNEANLVAYYPFDEGIGAIETVDRSVNTNDGTLNGGIASLISEVPLGPPLNLSTLAPAANEIGVVSNSNISMAFDANVDGATINGSNIIVTSSLRGIMNSSYLGGASPNVTVDTDNNFLPGEEITVTITDGLRGVAGEVAVPFSYQFTAQSSGPATYVNSAQLLGSQNSYGVVAGDFDEDGDIDVVTANFGASQSNQVWLNNGVGGFSAGAVLGSSNSDAVAVADLDLDGDVDIVFSNSGVNEVWLNDGGGTAAFTAGENIGSSIDTGIGIGDLNGDTYPDLFYITNSGNVVYLNDQDGTFTASPQGAFLSGLAEARDLSLGDIDNDGDLDAVVVKLNSSPDVVWINDGSGFFSEGFNTTGSFSRGVDMADLNGDGFLDIFIASGSSQPQRIWLNDQDGTFTNSSTFGGLDTYNVDLGDLDGDGDIDALLANVGGANQVYLNDGLGTFTLGFTAFDDDNSRNVVLADFDADGSLDAFFANFGGGTNTPNGENGVWLNTTLPALAPTDFIAYESAGNIVLNWVDNATDETGFLIERADDYAFTANILDITSAAGSPGVDATTATYDPSGVDYYYRVTAVNGFEDASSRSTVEFASPNPFPGQALNFDGVDDYIEIADAPSLNRSVITMEAWFRTTMTGVGKIMGKGNGTVQKYDLTMGFPSSGRVAFASNDGISTRSVGSTTQFNDGLWHHVAGILDETTDRMEIYVDGVLQDSDNAYVNSSVSSTLPFYLGTNSVETFNGELDEFRIWDFAKNNFSDRFTPLIGNEAGLVAYYPVDEGIGATNTVDRSGNTNDGILNGSIASLLSDFIDPPVINDAIFSDTDGNGELDQVRLVFDRAVDINDAGGAGDGLDVIALNDGAAVLLDNADYTASGVTQLDLNFLGDQIPGTAVTGISITYQQAGASEIVNAGSAIEIADAATPAAFSDAAAPVVVSLEIFDNTGGDGRIDQIILTFSENIDTDDGSAPVEADFGTLTLPDGTVGPGITGTISDPAGITNTVTIDINNQLVSNTAVGSTGIDGIDGLWRDANPGNLLTATGDDSELIIDSALPTLIGGVTLDTNQDGFLDALEVQYSEPITDAGVTTNDFTISTDGGTTSDAFDGFSTAVNELSIDATPDDAFIALTLSSPINTSGTAAALVSYTSTTGIVDVIGNAAPDFTDAPPQDGAGPAIIAAVTDDSDGNGQIDQILVTLSENVNDASSILNASTFTVVGYSVTGTATGVADDDQLIISLTESGGPDTNVSPNVTLIAGQVSDGTNSIGTNQTFTATADGVGPQIAAARTLDQNANGQIDAIEVTFSENLNDAGSNFSAANWSVVGYTVANVTSGITNDNFIFLNLTESGSTDSEVIPANVTLNAQDYTDGVTFNASPQVFSGVTDGARPLALSFMRQTPTQEITNADNVTFRAEFSEDVTGTVDASDFIISGTSANIASVVPVSGTTYDLTLDGGNLATMTGTVGLSLSGSPTISDAAGNNVILSEPATDETYSIDNTIPIVSGASIIPATNSFVTSADLGYNISEELASGTATFTRNSGTADPGSPHVVTLAGAELLAGTFGPAALTNAPTLVDGAVYNIVISGFDLAGNATGDGTVTNITYDISVPSLQSFTRLTPSQENTSDDVLVFRATFSEDVQGVDVSDFSVNASTATVTGVVPVDGATYDITIGGGDLGIFQGVVGLDLVGGISDLAGNSIFVVEPGTDETYTLDNLSPTVSLSSSEPDPSSSSSFILDVFFSEAVTGLLATDFVVGNGAASGLTGSGSTYSVTITPISDGLVTVDLPGAVAQDAAMNDNVAATQFSITSDATVPTASLSSSEPDPTSSPSFILDVFFSEAVTGLLVTDFVVGNGAASGLTGSGATYSVTITPASDGLVTVDLPGAIAQDAALNDNVAATQFSITSDATEPTVSLSSSESDPTSSPSFILDVFFSEAVTGLLVTDFVVGNGSASGLTGSGSTYSVTITPASDGLVTVDLGAVAQDVALNDNVAATQFSITSDATGPTVSLSSSEPDPSSAPNFILDVFFSEAVTGLLATDFVVGNGAASGLTGSGSTYSVTITPTSDGPVTVDLPGAVAQDAALNDNVAATQFGITYDGTAPTTNSFVRQNPISSITNADVLDFRVSFSEDVTGVDAADFTVDGATTATVFSVTPIDGSTYDVQISGGDLAGFNGTVGLNFNTGSVSIQDLAGGNLSDVEPATDEIFTVDNTGFSVDITRQAPVDELISTGAVVFQVAFTVDVQNVTLDDFVLSGTASGTASLTSLGGSAATYTVSAAAPNDGTLQLGFSGGQDITNLALTPFSGVINTQESYNIDRAAPTLSVVSIASNNLDPAQAREGDVITLNFTSSEDLQNVTATIATNPTSVTGGPVNWSTTYTLTNTDLEGLIPFTIDFSDLASNAGVQVSATTDLSSVEFDRTLPTITGDQVPSVEEPATFVATYGSPETVSWSLSGIDASFFAIDAGGNLSFTSAPDFETPLDNGANNIYDVIVEATDATGNVGTSTVIITVTDLAESGPTLTSVAISSDNVDPAQAKEGDLITLSFTGSEDLQNVTVTVAGNAATVAGGPSNWTATYMLTNTDVEGAVPFTIDFENLSSSVGTQVSSTTDGSAVAYDRTLPSLVVSSSESDPTNVTAIPVTITFDEDVIGFEEADLTVTNGTLGNFTTVDATNYTVEITPSADGQITLDIAAAVAQDVAGNDNTAATQFTITSDQTAPGVAIATTETDPTNASVIPVTIAFDEDVIGFEEADLSVTNGTLGSFTTVDAANYTVEITPSADGQITLDVAAAVAQDGAGNDNTAATQFTITSDQTAPGVAIATTETDPTNASVIPVTIAFDEDVIGFEEADLTVTNGTLGSFTTVDAANYTVEITPSADGQITLDIAAGVAQDGAGNDNTAATQFTITSDQTAPGVAIATTANDPTSLATIPVTIAFDEDVTGFEAADLTVTNGTLGNFTTVDAANYTVEITPSADGQITLDIAAAVAQDGAGNDNIAATQFTITSDQAAPSVTLSTTAANPTNATTVTIDVAFSEAVTGFTIDDLTVTNGTLGNFTITDTANYTVDITPSADGQVTLDVAAGVAQDVNGNANTAATSLTFTYDGTAPVVTVDIYGTSISSPQLTGTVDDNTATISITVSSNSYNATNNGDGSWTLAVGTITPELTDGSYDVVATATDAVGNVGTDNTTDELTISQTVVALIATNITSTSFQANWSEGLDVQNYELDVSTSSDFSTFVDGFESLNTNTNTSATITGLDFSQSYYYRVRLVNTNDEVSDNSNTRSTKTTVDASTVADSLALTQIFAAINPQGLNWSTARLRDWDGITLNSNKTRVNVVNIANSQSRGAMPNPFTGDAQTNGGLSAMTGMDVSNNELTGLMDYTNVPVSTLLVNGNALTFEDLEPLVTANIATLEYADQQGITFNEGTGEDPIKIPHLTDYLLSIGIDGLGIGGSQNVYAWYRNDAQITSTTDVFSIGGPEAVILGIDFNNMGDFRAEVTSTLVPNLTIEVTPLAVLATADVTMTLSDGGSLISGEEFDGALLETVRRSAGYDTLEFISNVGSEFIFEDVVLGDYLCGIEPSNLENYIPTYFGGDIQWENADTVKLRANILLDIEIEGVPLPISGEGDGLVDIVIEEDFGDDGGRIDARRRAAKRKCGLRRKRSGGRTAQDDDDFELIAYGETDENGEFQFGFLPQGTYRFFVEYPGIPLDESSEVEFEVGETGISDTDFKLEAFATEDGISVSIDPILGVIFEYFKDLEVYPNPTTDYINIRYRHLKSQDVTVDMIDLSGNTKWSQDLRNGYDGNLRIDVTDFEEGIYLLRFYDNQGKSDNVVTYRIMVRK